MHASLFAWKDIIYLGGRQHFFDEIAYLGAYKHMYMCTKKVCMPIYFFSWGEKNAIVKDWQQIREGGSAVPMMGLKKLEATLQPPPRKAWQRDGMKKKLLHHTTLDIHIDAPQ